MNNTIEQLGYRLYLFRHILSELDNVNYRLEVRVNELKDKLPLIQEETLFGLMGVVRLACRDWAYTILDPDSFNPIHVFRKPTFNQIADSIDNLMRNDGRHVEIKKK